MLSAEQIVNSAANRAWTPPPSLTVTEWSDAHVWLGGDSPERGKYQSSRTPYVRGVMDCLSPSHPARWIAWEAGSQIGKTRVSLNWVGFKIDHDPQPMIIALPTQDVAKEWSQQRLAQLVDETPCLAGKIADTKRKGTGNATYLKRIKGTAATIKIAWSTSATKLRSTPAADILSDEVDGFLGDVEGEGDPLFLLNRRFTNFPRGKHYMCSTPGEDPSRIHREFLNGDQRHYFVPCPFCGHCQRLVFKRILWPDRVHGETAASALQRYEQAAYSCIACDQAISEAYKTQMLAGGMWVATSEQPRLRDEGFRSDQVSALEPIFAAMDRAIFASFHLPSFYSPVGWYSWSDLARDWEAARGDSAALKTLINTVFAEPWKQPGQERPNWEILKGRSEDYEVGDECVVPMRASFLTAAVDFQREWLQVELKAWGRGRENWSLGVWRVEQFDGNGNILQTKDSKYREWLRAFLAREWPHEIGASIPILAIGLDTGEQPDPVYDFAAENIRPQVDSRFGVRILSPRTVIPLKGASTADQHTKLIVRISPESAARKRYGLHIVHVGGGYAKGEFYGALNLQRNLDGSYPSGYCHFSRQYADWVFRGLCAEQKIDGEWKPVRGEERNEALDTHVYNRALASLVGIDRFREQHWENLERQMGISRPKSQIEQAPIGTALPAAPIPQRQIAQPRTTPSNWMRSFLG